MTKIQQAISNFLNTDRWAHEALAGQTAYRVFYQGENERLICFAQAREDEQQFIFYSYCPDNVPEDRRLPMAEFIARANYGMVLGNFELDFGDGELRFKTSIDVEGTELTHELIKPIIYANVLTMDQYAPGIKAVIEAQKTPDEALDIILSSDTDDSSMG
jgi:hypothetical protein